MLPLKHAVTAALVPLVAIGVFTIAGCGFVSGSGTIVTKQFRLSGFTGIDAGSSFQVRVVQAKRYSVSVQLDDNLVQYLDAKVSDGTLRLGLDDLNSYSNITLRATIAMPRLEEVRLSGASDGQVAGFRQDSPVRLDLSGASALELNGLRSTDGTVSLSGDSSVHGSWTMHRGELDLSGDSEVRLAGSSDSIKIHESGSSSAQLQAFEVRQLTADLSGDSDCTALVTGSLSVSASGDSSLSYLGTPALTNVSTSGSSDVRRAGQ